MCSSCEGFVLALLLPTGWDSVPAFLAANAWKATVILVAAFGTALLLRRASAAHRHLVWSAAVLSLVLLPLASLVLPNWYAALPTGSEMVWPAPAATLNEPASSIAGHAVAQTQNTVDPGGFHPGSAPLSMSAVLVAVVWAMGFCLVAGRLWIGRRRVSELARGAQRLETRDWSQASAQLAALLPLRRPVALLRSERVSIPMTAGFRRPVILLPKDAAEWPAERRWVVLAHELLHVQRADYSLWMLARLACALYWFHPLVWLAAARLRKEAEQACDNGVLRLGAEAPAYAEHLVSLARGWSLARTAELSAMAMAQTSHLESRIRALLDPARNRREVSRRSRLWIAFAAVLVLAPLAALRAPAQAAAASLQGTVSDISGARLPGALLTLRRVGDESKAVARTNDAGEFAFVSLPAGEYVIEVRKPGFQLQQESVKLVSGAHESLDITVNLGSVVEEIEIVGKSSAASERPSGPPRRIRVGGNVQRSKLITQIRPVYPEELKREGVEGMVVLEAVILTEGSLGNLRLANNLVQVDERLVNAAMEAIRYWRYEPTLLNGVPVEVVTTITLNFRLEP
jgi:TonB family protein